MCLADGLTYENLGHGWVRFRAGHRADLIGVAALGAMPVSLP